MSRLTWTNTVTVNKVDIINKVDVLIQNQKGSSYTSYTGVETTVNNASLPTLLSNSSLQGAGGKSSLSIWEVKPRPPPRLPEPPVPPETPTALQRSQKLQADGKPEKNGGKDSKAPAHSNSGKASVWKSAAKMVGAASTWRKPNTAGRDSSSSQLGGRISDDEVALLSKLESLLVADYGTVASAFQVVTADKASFTEIDLRCALSQHRSHEELMSRTLGANDIGLGDVPRVFASLGRLVKYESGQIPKNIFLMFPDRLRYERLYRARLERSGQDAPVEVPRLLQLLSKGAKNPEAAKKNFSTKLRQRSSCIPKRLQRRC
jgi:hypothetical protein